MEGQNIAFEFRWAEGQYERLPGLAAELVGLKVNIIVAAGPNAIEAAKQATATIPIVMAAVADPVATGFVASLARPGGNITGISNMLPDLVGKQLELLKEVLPTVSRVALLGNPAKSRQCIAGATGAGGGPDIRGPASTLVGTGPQRDRQRLHGDQFAYRILAGQIHDTSWIYEWDHESDSRQWFAHGLKDYFERSVRKEE